jgi:hypothetical protein
MKKIKKIIMKRKFIVTVSIVFLFVLIGLGGPTALEMMKKMTNVDFSLSGKVVDENGDLLDEVILKQIYHTPTFKAPDFASKKTIKKNIINGAFDVNWHGSAVELFFGKKGYHPAKYSIFGTQVRRMTEKEMVAKKIRDQKEKANLYMNMKHQKDDIVITLRKIGKDPVKLLKRDYKRYTLGLRNGKKNAGVKFTDKPKTSDKNDLSLVLGEDDNGNVKAWLETPEEGGIIFVKPYLDIHQMFEAPEDGYQQKININELNREKNSFYLKTPEGLYVKGVIASASFTAKKGSALVRIFRSAIQPDKSRNLESIDEKLLKEIENK